MSKEGLFLSFEGGDGVGKETQHGLLVDRLVANGEEIMELSFPQYEQPLGQLIKQVQHGLYGNSSELGPRFASSFYALDRASVAPRIREALAAGSIVLANRFSASNMAYQAAKIPTIKERRKLIRWIDQYEHVELGTPRPDFHIILQLPLEIALERMQERVAKNPDRALDDHESNPDYLRRSANVYLELAEADPDRYSIIWCADEEGQQRTREDIHEEIWSRFEELRSS